jgi:hypothetical protein
VYPHSRAKANAFSNGQSTKVSLQIANFIVARYTIAGIKMREMGMNLVDSSRTDSDTDRMCVQKQGDFRDEHDPVECFSHANGFVRASLARNAKSLSRMHTP